MEWDALVCIFSKGQDAINGVLCSIVILYKVKHSDKGEHVCASNVGDPAGFFLNTNQPTDNYRQVLLLAML